MQSPVTVTPEDRVDQLHEFVRLVRDAALAALVIVRLVKSLKKPRKRK